MLEPRRLAAQRAAAYMALQLGERPGATVGYRIRGETRVSPATRIEVVTEGVLTRMLRHAPELPGVSLLIFDEFHERSIHADIGLALALDVQTHLREDLRILVMSATLDGLAVAGLLGGAPVVESAGRSHPVDTRYLPASTGGQIPALVVRTVTSALRNDGGDILVFLPGRGEIHRVASLLEEAGLPSGVRVHTLFGEAPAAVQDAALTPEPAGLRKIVLATSIAETSLTIDGIRIVVDAGLARSSRFDPRRGMAGLVTGPVSQAAADQRRGRAGRQAPGICYRLWTEEHHRSLQQYAPAEILVTDLAPLALDLAAWGAPEGTGLRFLDPPSQANLSQARGLLRQLGALDEQGAMTTHGREMSRLPVHPRLSHMILRGSALGHGPDACALAALLEDRDPLRGEPGADIDLGSRWRVVYTGRPAVGNVHGRILREFRRLMEIAAITGDASAHPPLGLLTALAYPERIARRRDTEIGRYLTAGGTGAVVPERSILSREEFLAVATLDGAGTEARIQSAAPLQREELLSVFAELITSREDVFWDDREEAVVARTVQSIGAVTLSAVKATPSSATLRTALLQGVRRLGLPSLPWNRETESLRARSEWLRGLLPPDSGWPDLSDEALVGSLESWLAPFLEGISGRSHFQRIRLGEALRGLFSRSQRAELDRLAPVSWTTPAGTAVQLAYTTGMAPVAAVKLQEMFGQSDTPLIGGGRARITMHLLSPAGRPLAVTQDLKSFWLNVYPEVRKEMRGRYPKHIWPEDPLAASPTRRTVQRRPGR
jgi:ATP-dependent helicase HrpB